MDKYALVTRPLKTVSEINMCRQVRARHVTRMQFLTDKSVTLADSRNKAEGCIVFTVTNHVQMQGEF